MAFTRFKEFIKSNRIQPADISHNLSESFSRLLNDKRGGIALYAGLTLPVAALAAGIAVDYSGISSARSNVQEAADAAAVAAAREMVLSNTSTSTIKSVASHYVIANLDMAANSIVGTPNIKTNVDKQSGSLTVKITAVRKNFFGNFLQPAQSTIKAEASAQALGNAGGLCLLSLETWLPKALNLEDNAKIRADKCGVYSNSRHRSGIYMKKNSSISAGLICSAGGAVRERGFFSPQPTTDCPVMQDPLAVRPKVNVNACDYQNTVIHNKVTTLNPGVYCGGLTISGNSNVNLRPGVYVMSSGPLDVLDSAKLQGKYAGFYLEGAGSNISFEPDTTISLVAPKSGPLAGLLFYQTPDKPASSGKKGIKGIISALKDMVFRIKSNNAHTLLGTIYIPRGLLIIDANGSIAQNSAYTVIIARMFKLHEGPTLVLNSDYSATDVPLPGGLRGNMGKITLSK
ncbi:MAG: pilus assembly protein TadG-related protein [Pseudomonadota bacterium]